MDDGKKVVIEKVTWSDETAAGLTCANVYADNFVKELVQNGVSECFKLHGLGYIVLTNKTAEKELRVEAVKGRNIYRLSELIKAVAKKNKAEKITAGTEQRRVVRALKMIGFKLINEQDGYFEMKMELN